MLRRLLPALLIGPAALVATASAETLDDALAAAYLNNPNLEDARLAVRSAREDSAQARAAYMPTLNVVSSYGVRNLETETPSFFGPQIRQTELEPLTSSVQVQQQLYTGGRRTGQMRFARAGLESARHGLRSVELDVLLAAVDAYLNLRRDEEIVRLREEHVVGLTRQVRGTQRRLEVGEVSRTDVAQAQTRLAAARAALARAQAELEVSRARYELVVGHPPQDLTPVDTPTAPASLDEAVRVGEERHPDLLRALSNRRAAQARVDIERSALRPQVSVVGRYDYNEDSSIPEDRTEGSTALAQLSVPLYEGGFAHSRTRQQQINVERATAGVEARRREVVANVIAAWSNTQAGRDIVAAAREQVEAAELALEGAERERGLGLRSTLDVLDAEEERRNALIALTSAEADETFAGYALLAAMGTLTAETLEVKE
jgi:outer membrane protein